MNLTGSWETACATENAFTDSAFDKRETLVFSSAGTVTYVNNSFVSADASCTGATSVVNGYSATVSSQGKLAISDWLNGMNESVAPPTSQSGSALTTTESFTGLMYTMTALNNITAVRVGDGVQFGYVVDDTTSNIVLYRAENNNPQNSTGGTADPFVKVGSIADPGPAGVTITVTTESNNSLVLQGTYTSACYLSSGSGNYLTDSHVIDGDDFTYRVTVYNTTDCSGTGVTGDIFTGVLSVANDDTITDWVNGEGTMVQAPTASEGSRLLNVNATITILNVTLTGASPLPIFYVVDDTGSTPILYRSDTYTTDPYVATVSINDALSLE